MNPRTFQPAPPDSDFAETQPLAARGTARRDMLRIFRCACSAPPLVRINRSVWMRMLPRSRLYRCLGCGARVLQPRNPRQSPYGSVYLPPRPLRVAMTPERCNASVLDGVYMRTLRSHAGGSSP